MPGHCRQLHQINNLMREQNNFYASFYNIDKLKIKEAFERKGWVSGRAGWSDFELSNAWSELLLGGDADKPLLCGAVDYHLESLEMLQKIFVELEGKYQFEFYDENKSLIHQKSNGS